MKAPSPPLGSNSILPQRLSSRSWWENNPHNNLLTRSIPYRAASAQRNAGNGNGQSLTGAGMGPALRGHGPASPRAGSRPTDRHWAQRAGQGWEIPPPALTAFFMVAAMLAGPNYSPCPQRKRHGGRMRRKTMTARSGGHEAARGFRSSSIATRREAICTERAAPTTTPSPLSPLQQHLVRPTSRLGHVTPPSAIRYQAPCCRQGAPWNCGAQQRLPASRPRCSAAEVGHSRGSTRRPAALSAAPEQLQRPEQRLNPGLRHPTPLPLSGNGGGKGLRVHIFAEGLFKQQ